MKMNKMDVKPKFAITSLLFIYFRIHMVQSDFNNELNWSKQDKNGISFTVYQGRQFSIADPLRVLSQDIVANLEDMESLSLYHTGIEKIERGSFSKLPNLKSLVISAGNLKHIDNGIFSCLNITKLELKDCGIKTIASGAFNDMIHLEMVNFDNNFLMTWNAAWFINTPSLTEIHINFNLIEEIPENVVEDAESGKEYKIFLQKNNISRINEYAFRRVERIKILDLTQNKLEEFDGKFLENVSIQELKINNNKITCLHEENFNLIFKANLTDLSGNPWKLDCLNNIKNWIISHQKNVIF